MGDDLEDDYIQTAEEHLSDVDDDESRPQYDEELDGDADLSPPRPIVGGKRKAGDDLDDDEEGSDDGSPAGAIVGKSGGRGNENLTAEEKKRELKKRNKEKFKEKKKARLAASNPLSAPSTAGTSSGDIPNDPSALLRVLRASQKLSLKNLSELEWEERELPPQSMFVPSPSSTTTSSPLVDLIKSSIPLPTGPPSKNGAPHILVLASSGQRCADLVRELRALTPGTATEGEGATGKGKAAKGKGAGKKGKGAGEIAKLFAKHFKVSEHIAYLAITPLSMAVGTPYRVAELLKAKALHPPPYILLDASFRDSKTRTLLEIVECRDSIWREVFGPNETTGGLLEGLRKEGQAGEEGVLRVGVF